MRTVLSQGGSFPGHGGEGSGEGEWIGMAEWIYFIHAPRDNFAATMTDEERRVWSLHFERFRLLADGLIVLVGPTLGPMNTGIVIFERRTRRPHAGSWTKIP